MNPRWRKVWGDLVRNPWRSLIVVVAIAVGTTAVVAAFGSAVVINREMTRSFHDTAPVQATLWLDEDADATLLTRIRAQPNIAAADSRRLVRGRVDVEGEGWHGLLVYGVGDFEALPVSAFHLHEGTFPAEGDILIEQSALPVLNVGIGDSLRVRTEDGEAELTVSGIVHDPALAPAWMENIGYAYASRETLALLGVGGYLDEIRITVGDSASRETTAHMTANLATWLDTQGMTVQRAELPPPGQAHPHYDQMGAVLTLLGLFSMIALVLSGTLTSSIMTALMAKQTRQVGILKSVGATSWQIAEMYLRLVVILGMAGVVVGLPLGILAASPFTTYATTELNLEVTSLAIPWAVLGGAALAGVTVPVLVAAVPVLRAARMTAREALQDTGIQMSAGNRTARVDVGDRTVTLALRNTFRRPGRLAMTLLALGLGGAVLMTAVNVYQSLSLGMERALTFRQDDIDVRLLAPAPRETLLAAAADVPGVAAVEVWGNVLASIALEDAERRDTATTERYALVAPPVDTEMVNFPVYRGRWLQAGDTMQVVINRALQDRERALALDVGSSVTVAAFGNTLQVEVVGVIEEAGPPSFYIAPSGLAQLTRREDTFSALRVIVEGDDPAQVAHHVEEALVDAGTFPFFVLTRDDAHEALLDHFIILLVILVTAAISVIIVGGLALTTTMSLSVIERQREIGIVRALGATRGSVMRLLLLEGGAVAAASIVLAVLLAIPLSALGSFLVGNHGLHMRLPLILSPWAIIGWMVLVSLVTLGACIGPAWNTLRLSVTDVLAYE